MLLRGHLAAVAILLGVGCSRPYPAESPSDVASAKRGEQVVESESKPSGEKAEIPEEKPKGIDIPKVVNASPGEAVRLGPLPKRSKLWAVRWKGARLDFGNEGQFSGFMERVTGDLYDKGGKVASTFQGREGEADKEKDVLRLSGEVKIVSKEHKASLFCDKVEYLPGKQLIRAIGNVRIESASGILSAGNEVLASADLRQVATPNLFKR